MTLHSNTGRHNRFVEAIAAGNATVEWGTELSPARHAITVKILDSNGNEDTPVGGQADIYFKAHKDDDYQQLMSPNGVVNIDLENGAWTVAFELPVVALKVIGSNLGANQSMVVIWSGWTGEY
jgi:hypothetical protein